MKSLLFIFLFLLVFTSFISAEFGFDDPDLLKVTRDPPAVITFENDTGSVNSSNFWDGLDTFNTTQMEDNGGMSIFTPDTSTSTIIFGSPADPLGADIKWNHDNEVFIIGSRKVNATLRFVSGSGITALNINKNQNFDFQDGNLLTTGTSSFGAGNFTGNLIIGTSVSPQNITMFSPNGTSWSCGVLNSGVWACS